MAECRVGPPGPTASPRTLKGRASEPRLPDRPSQPDCSMLHQAGSRKGAWSRYATAGIWFLDGEGVRDHLGGSKRRQPLRASMLAPKHSQLILSHDLLWRWIRLVSPFWRIGRPS